MAKPTTAPPPVKPELNINPSPRQRFQLKAENIRAHRAIIEKDEFQRSLDHALMQYQLMLVVDAKDGNSAAAAHYKMQGVLEFLHQFKYLAEQVVPERRKLPDQLDYKA